MAARAAMVYGVTLGVLLVGSYLSWTREDAAAEAAAVIVMDAESDDISKIVYTSEKLDLELDTRRDDLGTYLWVHATERKEEKKQRADDGHGHGHEPGDDEPEDKGEDGKAAKVKDGEAKDDEAKDDEPATPTIVTTETVFKAGDAGTKLLERFAPFEANRLLEVSGEDKLAEFGLDAPTETLELHRAGKDARVFDIGGEAYGTRDRYLRDRASGKVYLVEADALNPLKRGTTSLPDRELLGMETEAIARVQVNTGTEAVEFEHRNRDDKDAAHWRTAGEDEANESAGTWLEKVFRLRSSGYVQPDEAPTGTELVFAVTAMGDDDTAITLEILKGLDPEGDEAWYGRSQHTRELVKLHKSPTSQAAEDITTILE